MRFLLNLPTSPMLPVAWPADFHLGALRPGEHRKVDAHDPADRLARFGSWFSLSLSLGLVKSLHLQHLE